MAPPHVARPPINGRPLIFTGMVLTAWTGTRLALSFTAADAPVAMPAARSVALTLRQGADMPPATAPTTPMLAAPHPWLQPHPTASPPVASPTRISLPVHRRSGGAMDLPALLPPIALLPLAQPADSLPATSPSPRAKRLHTAAWLFWRPRSRPVGSRGQLGGSQTGLRLDRDIATFPTAGMSAYGRITSALEHPHGAELALGAALYPRLPWPLSLGIERRVALDASGRNAFALLAVTGLRCNCGPGRLILDGYAQGGMVGFDRQHGFADARLSVFRPLTPSGLSAGASIAGGVQPGLARLDIGPVMEWQLPLRPMSSRLTIEWRERIAGTTAPGSGLAVTLAADF